MFKEIKAIIFDMDGLIINTEKVWREAEIKTFKTVGIELDEHKCMQTMGLRVDEAVDYWYRKFPWINKNKSAIVSELLQILKESIETEGQAMPGFLALLEDLKAKNYPTAIASSSHEVLINATVKRLGLAPKIDVCCSAEREAYGKPHPAVFLSAAHALNTHPEDCLVFEDSVTGVIAAKAARMKVIAVPAPENFEDKRFAIADKKIKSLKELL